MSNTTALEAEQKERQGEIAQLEAQRAVIAGNLDTLLAEAERRPGPGTLKAAQTAESDIADLGDQLKRKRAALAAVAAELAESRREDQAAQRDKIADELHALIDQAHTLARRIDENIGDTTAWGELYNVYRATLRGMGRLSNTAVGDEGVRLRSLELFDNPQKVRGAVFERVAVAVDMALGTNSGGNGRGPATVGEALGLAKARARIQAAQKGGDQ